MRKPRNSSTRKPLEREYKIPSPLPKKRVAFSPEDASFRPFEIPQLYPPDAPVTEERLINAMKTVAYVMTSGEDGEVLSPIFERLDRELAALRERKAPVERARKFLEAHTIDASTKIDHQP